MDDLMTLQADVMVVVAHAGEDLAHVPVHVLVDQDLVPAPEAAAVMIGAVAAMTPTAEAKERADRDHTAAVKVVTGAVRTAKARMTTETQGTLRKMITKPKETETTTADQGTARSGKKTTVERTAEVMIGTVTATIAMLKTIDVPSHALVRTPAPDLHRRIDGFTRVY